MKVFAPALALLLADAGQSARDPIDPHLEKVSVAEFDNAEVQLPIVPPPYDKTKSVFDQPDLPPIRDEKRCRMTAAQMGKALDIMKRSRVTRRGRLNFDVDFVFMFVDPRGGLYALDVGFAVPRGTRDVNVYADDYVGTLGAAEYRRAVELAIETGCKP